MLLRHGPSAYWSSFAFESRLGDLKRACLKVGNNLGVAQRGGDIVMEMFSVRCNSSTRTSGFRVTLLDWVCRKVPQMAKHVSSAFPSGGLESATPVVNVERFEGRLCGFQRGAFLVPYDFTAVPLLAQPYLYHLIGMCRVEGTHDSIPCCILARNFSILTLLDCRGPQGRMDNVMSPTLAPRR